MIAARSGGPTGRRRQKVSDEERWRGILTGEARGHVCWNPRLRRAMRAIPSDPRCKLCDTPSGAPGGVMRFIGFGPSRLNRRICSGCIHALAKRPGGAEVEVTSLFADVRGSRRSPSASTPSRSRSAWQPSTGSRRAIDRRNGIVDKFVGDEVVGFFAPGFGGSSHTLDAVEAGREIVSRVTQDGEASLGVGAAVHTGIATVGNVGTDDASDSTAVGDAVNTAARLAASAASGELLVSASAATAAALDTDGLERRTLSLRGREAAVDAWVETSRSPGASPARTGVG